MDKTEKKRKPGRDERGVRINNYEETTHGRMKADNKSDAINLELLAMIKDSINGVTRSTTPEGETVEVVRTGRPRKYPEPQDIVNIFNEYITYIENTLKNKGLELIPDLEGFCTFAGISRETFFEWERSRGPVFSDLLKQIRTFIASYKKQKASRGEIPALVFTVDLNNNHGYIQQQKVEINSHTYIEELPKIDDIRGKLAGLPRETLPGPAEDPQETDKK